MGKKRPPQVKEVHEQLKKNSKQARWGAPFAKWRKEENRWELGCGFGRGGSMFYYPSEDRWTFQAPYYDEEDSSYSRALGNAYCWFTG